MKLNKTLHPSDYDHLKTHVALFNDVTSKVDAIIHHKHRRWEYGVALAALDLIRSPQSILDIGGGGSPLPAMVASLGYTTYIIDPSPEAKRQGGFNDDLGIHINVDIRDFMDIAKPTEADAVFCISTLEHVQDDVAFFQKALSVAKHLAVFTVDYHTTAQAQSKHHLRTYNRASLERLAALSAPDWELVDSPSWEDHGAQVYNYNFAAMVLRRKMPLKALSYSPDSIGSGFIIPEYKTDAEKMQERIVEIVKEATPDAKVYTAKDITDPDSNTEPYEVDGDTQPEKPKRKRGKK